MIIYDNEGIVLLDIEVDDTSVRYKAIKGENSLTLRFSLAEHVEVPLGAYCEFKGETYILMLPEDLTMNHRRSFEYSLVMHSEDAKSKRFMFINPADGRLKFSLTAKPHEHLQMFCDNMNKREGGDAWKIGECVDHVEIVLSYNHTYCYDALVQLANELELDYWFEGKTVNLGKLEVNKDEPLPLSYGGDGLGLKPNIKRTNYEDALPIEILYVQGSTENIDFSKYGSKELHLPKWQTIGYDGSHFSDEDDFDSTSARWYGVDGKGYSISRTDKAISTHAEDSLDCSEIVPTKEEVVDDVVVVDMDNHFFDILFISDIDYSKYQIAGETVYIVFQKGMLAGKQFDLATYDNGNLKCTQENGKWRVEIKPQEIDGILMPDTESGYVPVKGETFKVFGIQLPNEYIGDNLSQSGAEWEMFRYAVKHLYANEDVQYTISGELDELYAKRNWSVIEDKIVLGGYVSFSDKSFQEEPLLIRITGIKEYVNKPYSPSLEISNSAIAGSIVGAINRMENQEAETDEKFANNRQFTNRRFSSIKETLSMLQVAFEDFSPSIDPVTVQTMSLVAGDTRSQFRFTESVNSLEPASCPFYYDKEAKKMKTNSGALVHFTLNVDDVTAPNVRTASDYLSWVLDAGESEVLFDGDKPYYVCVEAPKDGNNAQLFLTPTPVDLEVGDSYYFYVGILNSESNGTRDFATIYGFTEVAPGRIVTNVIRSADGKTYFDLEQGNIGGRIKFLANDGSEKSIAEDLDFLTTTFGKGSTDINGGVVMSSVVAVKDAEGEVIAMLNGSELAEDDIHGKLNVATGIPAETASQSNDFAERCKEAATRLYEDGTLYSKSAHLHSGCTIGDVKVTEKGVEVDSASINGKATFDEDGVSVNGTLSNGNAFDGTLGNCGNSVFNVQVGDSFSCPLSEDGQGNVIPIGIFSSVKNGVAFRSDKGVFEGLRPKVRKIKSTTTYLNNLDHTVVCTKMSGIYTVYLPANPENGQEIKIWKNNTHTLDIETIDERIIMRLQIQESTSHSIDSTFSGCIDLMYCDEVGYWMMLLTKTM